MADVSTGLSALFGVLTVMTARHRIGASNVAAEIKKEQQGCARFLVGSTLWTRIRPQSFPADNPWLHAPLADYEGHMFEIGLADRFEATLTAYSLPNLLHSLGTLGGNRLRSTAVTRVVGIDINAQSSF